MYIYYLQLYTTQKNISSNNLLNSHFSYEFEIIVNKKFQIYEYAKKKFQ